MLLVKSVLITRPIDMALDFARMIAAQDSASFVAFVAPLTEIRPMHAVVDLSDVTALIFTSANAVRQFSLRWNGRGMAAYCVGQTTAAAASRANMRVVSAGRDVTHLEHLIVKAAPKGRLVHLHGVHVSGDLKGNLLKRSIEVESVVIYDQITLPFEAWVDRKLEAGEIDVATFFSARAAQLFAGAGNNWDLGKSTAICLSANVAAKLSRLGFARIRTVDVPDSGTMLAELRRLV